MVIYFSGQIWLQSEPFRAIYNCGTCRGSRLHEMPSDIL